MQTRYRTAVTGFILPGRPDYAAKNRGVPFERPGLFLGFLDPLFGVGHFSEPVVRRRAGLAVKNDQPDAPHQRNQTDQNPVPLLVDILQPPYGDSQGRNQQRQTVQTAQDRVQSDDTANNPDDHGGDHIVQNELLNTIQQALKNRTPQLNGEKYLTNREVCQLLRISPRTLQNWRDTGKIPFIRLKGKILYKESEILKELK